MLGAAWVALQQSQPLICQEITAQIDKLKAQLVPWQMLMSEATHFKLQADFATEVYMNIMRLLKTQTTCFAWFLPRDIQIGFRN